MTHSQRLDIYSGAFFIASIVLFFVLDMHSDIWRSIVIGLFVGSIVGWITRGFRSRK